MRCTIQNAFLSVTAESLGAQLSSIRGADGTEYLWQGDPAYWADRALNIFPYVARLTEGKYQMDGREYAMAIHGIAPYRAFTLAEQTENTMTWTLASDEETRGSYPRDFSFSIRYTLEENTLDVGFLVENRDEKPMYFGLGGHPGFSLPLKEGLRFEDYRLVFSKPCSPKRVGFTKSCFLDGTTAPFPLEENRILPLRHSLFEEDAIVLSGTASQVTLEADSGPRVTVTYPQMAYLGIWHTPKTEAPFVCIEPWCSLPATENQTAVFETQKDLITLAPGKTYENHWSIRVYTDQPVPLHSGTAGIHRK